MLVNNDLLFHQLGTLEETIVSPAQQSTWRQNASGFFESFATLMAKDPFQVKLLFI